MIFPAIFRWHPMASIVTVAPLIVSRSKSFGMATISLDLSATFAWPSTKFWRALHAEIIWMGRNVSMILRQSRV